MVLKQGLYVHRLMPADPCGHALIIKPRFAHIPLAPSVCPRYARFARIPPNNI